MSQTDKTKTFKASSPTLNSLGFLMSLGIVLDQTSDTRILFNVISREAPKHLEGPQYLNTGSNLHVSLDIHPLILLRTSCMINLIMSNRLILCFVWSFLFTGNLFILVFENINLFFSILANIIKCLQVLPVVPIALFHYFKTYILQYIVK